MGIPFTRFWTIIVSCLLLKATQPSATAAAASEEHHGGSQTQSQRRRLQVRTASVDTTDLICELGRKHSISTTIRSYEIPYFFALGTKTDVMLPFVERHQLQQHLFASIREQISWCYKEVVNVVASDTGDNNNRQRQLQIEKREENNQRRRQVLLDTARKLGILSVASGPAKYDVGPCPNVDFINEKIESTGATSCQLVEGRFRVTAHSVDDLDYLTATLLDGMEEGMNLKEVWGDWITEDSDDPLPDVAFLCYMGDTYEQAYYPPLPPPLIATPRTAGDGGGGGGALVLLIGVGLPVATAFALLALLIARKRRETVTASQFAKNASASRDASSIMNSDFVLVGVGDPPRSFHEGLYHYMWDGTRYLSTNCENCLETRRNSFYTDDILSTIQEDQVYEDPVHASSKDLGGKTQTMDVHACRSTACNRCSPRSMLFGGNGTSFVPSETSNNYDDEMEIVGLYFPPTEHVEV